MLIRLRLFFFIKANYYWHGPCSETSKINTLFSCLVEGQLDAIRCWSLGLNTAIAPQGTAITEEQLLLLRRMNPQRLNAYSMVIKLLKLLFMPCL